MGSILFEGFVYQFTYNLEQHRLLGMSLRRWLILFCLAAPLGVWLDVWRVTSLTAVLVTLGAGGILVALWQAGRRRYVRFVKDAQGTAPSNPPALGTPRPGNASPLRPMSKVRVRATGLFEVSGMRRYLVENPADYTTVETREHCVMAHVPFTRFLVLSVAKREQVGWWYTFFQPATIREVTEGCLHFGLRPRPAVRLRIALPGREEDEILHFSFDDEAARSLVLADLRYDAGLKSPA